MSHPGLTSAEETSRLPPASASEVRTAELRDHRPSPQGVVPRQSQAYVIAGVAVLILFAVMFSNKRARTTAHAPSSATSYGPPASEREIEELKRDLTADQQKMDRQNTDRQNTDLQNGGPQSRAAADRDDAKSSAWQGEDSGERTGTRNPDPAADARRQVADQERTLLFKARFASNLVFPATGQHALPAPLPASVLSGAAGASPADETASAQPTHTPDQPRSTRAFAQAGDSAQHKPEVNVNSAEGPPYVLFEGTTIDTALLNRLDAEFAGPVKVMVTTPLYSQNRAQVLVPEGTLIVGEVRKVSGFGQKRLAVVFHRMLMPDGYSIDLDGFPGLDQAGQTGLKDKVNNHYLQIFGTSIALGIIGGAAEGTTSGGLSASGSDLWRQGVASSLSQSSANVLDRFMNVLPTLTIREGHSIKVYLTQDLLLPAYRNHTIPPDI
jgi:type IV secretion system protein TrbI